MILLDDTVRMVMLQFSFSNADAIPLAVKRLNRETQSERTERKIRSNGSMIIDPTVNCSLERFLYELEASGYEMVDALCKERIDAKSSYGRYHMVRFIFARSEFVNISDWFKKVRDSMREELQIICDTAFWRVRVYLNPFFNNGEEVLGRHAVSINLEARQPLFRSDSQPVTVWQKDGKGNRIGEAPLPLEADFFLRVQYGAISLRHQP